MKLPSQLRPAVLGTVVVVSILLVPARAARAEADAGPDGGAAQAVEETGGAATPAVPPSPTPVMPAPPGPAPAAHVMTMGPGSHPFFKFGHNALWVAPPGTQGRVYNFGTFAFDTPALIPKFIMGRFYYWLSVAGLADAVWVYRSANRQIEAQALALTPAQAHELYRRLQENARPENREYLYDYFRDNCSTRVRDALDAVLDGRLRAELQAKPAEQTYREHALRLTADVMWEYVALHFVLGSVNDMERTRWDEAFIPEVFQEAIRGIEVPRPDGTSVPLVASERVVFASSRAPPLAEPPTREPYFLLIGLLLGGVFALWGWAARRVRLLRLGLGLALCGLGLIAGFLGGALCFIWFFTDHTAVDGNENILLCGPWMLALCWFGIGVARVKARATRRALRLVQASVAICVLAMVAKVLPGFRQDNLAFILFFVPLWVGVAAGLWFLVPHVKAPREARAANKSA